MLEEIIYGFKYIKENYNTKYICMLNNDTKLLQDDFLDIIEKEYNYSKFDVMGPKILLPGENTNPIQKELITVKELDKVIFRYKIIYACNKVYLGDCYENLKKLFLKLTHKQVKTMYTADDINKRQENIVLHGAFLIFSKNYIEKFDGLNPNTFLYMEEKILAATLKKNNMKSVYNPKLVVYHNEDSSTNALITTKREKKLFIYKHAINSSKVLRAILEEVEK